MGFGGGLENLNQQYNQYQSGQDLNFDTDTHAAIRDRFGREFQDQYAQQRGYMLDQYDSGIMPSSLAAIHEAELGGQFANAQSNALLDAYLGIRGQNMGLLTDFAGIEGGRINANTAASASRYGADQARIASMYGADQGLAGARLGANASRYATDAQRAANNQTNDWRAWQAQFDLANLGYQDAYSQWNYGTGFDQDALNQYLQQVGSIAGGGSTTVGGIPQTNSYLTGGNTLTGGGLLLQGWQ